MSVKTEIPHRNRNHTGWWIVQEVEQWCSDRQKALKPGSRLVIWENTRLIRANSREEAYEKAMRLGAQTSPSRTNGGEWRFLGLSQLLPVYEELEDGAEILWTDRGRMRQEAIRKLVKSREQLAVFDDREPA